MKNQSCLARISVRTYSFWHFAPYWLFTSRRQFRFVSPPLYGIQMNFTLHRVYGNTKMCKNNRHGREFVLFSTQIRTHFQHAVSVSLPKSQRQLVGNGTFQMKQKPSFFLVWMLTIVAIALKFTFCVLLVLGVSEQNMNRWMWVRRNGVKVVLLSDKKNTYGIVLFRIWCYVEWVCHSRTIYTLIVAVNGWQRESSRHFSEIIFFILQRLCTNNSKELHRRNNQLREIELLDFEWETVSIPECTSKLDAPVKVDEKLSHNLSNDDHLSNQSKCPIKFAYYCKR